MNIKSFTQNRGVVVQDPPFAKFLLADTRASAIWLVIRVLLGLAWVDAASHKLSSAAWMDTGEALKGYWTTAVQIPDTGRPAVSFDWYRTFLQSMLDSGSYVWFAKLISIGELAVGIALIIGAFVGIAAFFGAFMNWNYIMAGSASTNPLLMVGAILLILAWKVAGYYGADYFLLRWLGTPWKRSEPAQEGVPLEGGRSPSKA